MPVETPGNATELKRVKHALMGCLAAVGFDVGGVVGVVTARRRPRRAALGGAGRRRDGVGGPGRT
jgi:hypothetical protein